MGKVLKSLFFFSDRTYKVIKLAHETLTRAGKENPSIAVCGINPHAGENGLFGNGEEEEKLIPGIRKAQVEGTMQPDHIRQIYYFTVRVHGDFDIVVACYHDQGYAPIKVLGLEAGVNITVSLKGGIIRTSVDHGTAFDIAGKNLADERSMLEAIRPLSNWLRKFKHQPFCFIYLFLAIKKCMNDKIRIFHSLYKILGLYRLTRSLCGHVS